MKTNLLISKAVFGSGRKYEKEENMLINENMLFLLTLQVTKWPVIFFCYSQLLAQV